MSDIEVTTTVTIKDAIGREIVSLTKGEVQYVTDNPRFWATYTRGAIQHTEHAIAGMLISQFGDKP
jgi:hypothetical protein